MAAIAPGRGQAPAGRVDRAVGLAAHAGAILGGICMNLLFGIIFLQILARNLFGASWGFVLDLGGWLMVAMTFLGFAWVLRQRAHISLELVTERLPPAARRVVTVLASTVSLGFCVFFLVSAWRNLAQVFRTGVTAPGALDVPIWPVWALVVFGLAVFAAQLALDLVDDARAVLGRRAAVRTAGDSGFGS